MGAAQPRRTHCLFGASCPSCVMEYMLVALLGGHGWWWGCFLQRAETCLVMSALASIMSDVPGFTERARAAFQSSPGPDARNCSLDYCLCHSPVEGFSRDCWSLGFPFLWLPPSPNSLQKFALQTGSSWCLKFELSGSSCLAKPWKLVNSEMYAPRKCKRASAAALILWRPPQAFVTIHAEMQPGPLRNRVITYLGNYQGKQAVTIMFGKHSRVKDMLQIRYLINLCFYTESIISGPVFLQAKRSMHASGKSPASLL